MIMTGPADSEPHFQQFDEFIAATLGDSARRRYKIIIDDPRQVARELLDGVRQVRDFRKHHGDAYYFNWRLKIDHDFQMPFTATHESMRSIELMELSKSHSALRRSAPRLRRETSRHRKAFTHSIPRMPTATTSFQYIFHIRIPKTGAKRGCKACPRAGR